MTRAAFNHRNIHLEGKSYCVFCNVPVATSNKPFRVLKFFWRIDKHCWSYWNHQGTFIWNIIINSSEDGPSGTMSNPLYTTALETDWVELLCHFKLKPFLCDVTCLSYESFLSSVVCCYWTNISAGWIPRLKYQYCFARENLALGEH